MIYLAVLWSYVTDAWLRLRRWRARRRVKRDVYRNLDAYFAAPQRDSDEYLYRRPGTETAQEWFARTEGKTK